MIGEYYLKVPCGTKVLCHTKILDFSSNLQKEVPTKDNYCNFSCKIYTVENTELKLTTDSHVIIFRSFFSFLRLGWSTVKIILWSLLSDQWNVNVVNIWATSDFRKFFCTVKVSQLTVNMQSYLRRTPKTICRGLFIQWVEILPCQLTAITPHLHAVCWQIFFSCDAWWLKKSAWCMIVTTPPPPPPLPPCYV